MATGLDIGVEGRHVPHNGEPKNDGVSMVKFDMGAAWDDATTLVKAHLPLTGILAAIFLFLPGMALALLGPAPLTPPANATPDQLLGLMMADLRQQFPWLLAVALASTLGSVAILRLWLARSGTSVGEALAFAFTMIPTLLAVFVIQSFIFGIAFLLLFVPLIYLIGRFAAVYPLLADRDLKNPIAALQGSWQLTQGNGWRVALFVILFMIVLLVVSAIVGSVTSLFGAPGSFGHLIGSAINAAVSAAFGLLNTAVYASIYRQLTVRADGGVFA
jgi:ABC-type multidrug transport system fused ATPase/permease subunit